MTMALGALASTMRAYSGCTLLPRPITSCMPRAISMALTASMTDDTAQYWQMPLATAAMQNGVQH